jgi:ABC-2 type transport system ATP-binding protein
MEADAAIRTHDLTKAYPKVTALDGLDLEVARGEVFGYIGPNGAGKSTTIRLLLDLLRPTRGSAEILGMDVRRRGVEVRRRLGYLAGELALYEESSGRELLTFLAKLRGGVDRTWVAALADRFGLPLDRPIRELSKGNKQKVGLIQAFMHRPEVLILDEPTSGLDPLLQRTFHELVAEASAEGATVLLSSHVLSELEHVADRVAMIRAGRLLAVERIEDLKRSAPRKVAVTFAAPVPADGFAGLPGVSDVDVRGALARFTVHGGMDAVVKAIAGHEVVSLTAQEPELEELFLDRYDARGAQGGPPAGDPRARDARGAAGA